MAREFKCGDLVRVNDISGTDLIGKVGWQEEEMVAVDFFLSDSNEYQTVYTIIEYDKCILITDTEMFKAKLEGLGMGISNARLR